MPQLRLAGLGLIAAAALSACASGRAAPPPTLQDNCAAAVAAQLGLPAAEVGVVGTAKTMTGTRTYATARGATYICEAAINGAIQSIARK